MSCLCKAILIVVVNCIGAVILSRCFYVCVDLFELVGKLSYYHKSGSNNNNAFLSVIELEKYLLLEPVENL